MLWQPAQQDAPAFLWDEAALLKAEWLYLAEAGLAAGAAKHLDTARQGELAVSSLTADALASLELENEIAQRDRMEICVRHHMGLPIAASIPKFTTHERCAAEVVVRVLQRFASPPTLEAMNEFGDRLAGPDGAEGAPPPVSPTTTYPDKQLELASFVRWYGVMSRSEQETSPLVQAGLAHLWFESIHPFRCGNGIVGRALAEKTLLLHIPGMFFTPLAPTLLRYRNEYFSHLDRACKDRDATEWLLWFAAAAIEAVREHRAAVSLINDRTQLLDNLRDHITKRQETLLLHLFGQAMEGSDHGISTAAYADFANIGDADAAADLAHLLGHEALTRTIRGNAAHYHLNRSLPAAQRVATADII